MGQNRRMDTFVAHIAHRVQKGPMAETRKTHLWSMCLEKRKS